jgi:peroxiredoxin
VPGYLAKAAELKAKGVSDVLVYCVNDAAVMDAWAKDQGTKGTIISMFGDTRSELTKALGLVLEHPGPMAKLGNPRCKRFSMLIEDGVVKTLNVSHSDADPAGDDDPSASCVDKMLADL